MMNIHLHAPKPATPFNLARKNAWCLVSGYAEDGTEKSAYEKPTTRTSKSGGG